MISKIFSFISFLILLIVPTFIFADVEIIEENISDETVVIHFFEDSRCPDCSKQKQFLEDVILKEYSNTEIKKYEISNPENQRLLIQMMKDLDVTDYKMMVPTTFIGDNYFQGFYSEDKDLIKKAIEGDNILEAKRGCVVSIPIIGEVCMANWPLPALAIVLGSLDGLNVCSIGALILILMIVLSFDSRKKILFFGGLFIFTTVLIYGILVFAWTALFQSLAIFIGPINIVIGIAALLGAIYFLKEFIRFYKQGATCQSSTNKIVVSATNKIQNTFANEKSKTIALITAVIVFASVITLVELPCSFGLPMVYGGILAGSSISGLGYLFYISLYLLFYMLIEIIIFIGAVITKEIWITESNIITWVYLAGTMVLFFLSYYYLIGF